MTTVFLIVGVRAYYEGLAALFAERGVRVAGSATTCEAGVAGLSGSERPVVVLLDALLEDAPDAASRIGVARPRARTLLVSIPAADWDLSLWSDVPVAGYLDSGASFGDVFDAVGVVANGDTACSPAVAAQLVQRLASTRSNESAAESLTIREQEIATLVAQGLSNKEIARLLSIALPTVKNHVHSILVKLGAQRRSEAAACLNGNRRPVGHTAPISGPRSSSRTRQLEFERDLR